MPRLTLPLLTKGAELNDCALVEAVEVDLHGKGLEAIELVGSVCRRLRVLHLQNNLIPRIQQLHRLKARRSLGRPAAGWSGEGLGGCMAVERRLSVRRLLEPIASRLPSLSSTSIHQLALLSSIPLQELEVLNLAVNNIRRVQNLQRCESLRRLDLSLNFVAPAGLPSLHRWVLGG